MKKIILFPLLLCCTALSLFAHFQIVYTPSSIIESSKNTVDFIISFTHPFESGLTMDIGKNEAGEIKGLKEFYSIHKEKKSDLIPFLKESEFASLENKAFAYTFEFNKDAGFKGGGDWVLVAVPHPYFEAADDGYIQQITKVFINKAGLSTDWQSRAAEGYPEIMPLVKPYDVWEGGVIRALVLDSDGNPVPYAQVEFENVNYDVDMSNKKFTGEPKLQKAGAGLIMADNTGVFEFIPPCPGYWGFAALGAGKEKEFGGKELSQDAVIWFEVMKIEAAAENSVADMTGESSSADEGKSGKARPKDGFSPAALVIVILLFVVMFAWPPIFKKISDKAENK
ncbi:MULTISPECIES: DUF4198 domain-containing protein [unclassified Treponema]|uniref:DUF4198 domain-containing protein n=1 Tax=unclassified Treponema TaxID=2638727 RepID=UPI0020A542BB|nr:MULTISPECIES: DUF4198 domain-containing protein [unclassified Treponema]UTC67716.1 DUF4198 domain-containing protein [Treponema sp. OMZ 789]UTC70444.1 DUF4198 domain-containing protein [Treponema sp. OMZ 790]UTC73157.1 DUF4198 domain-containing protein [Treponema sp. OMZ 791]